MSHGKSLWRKGSASVKIGSSKKSFSAEEKVGLVKGHGDSFDTKKADKAILDDINFQIDKAWKKAKQAGPSPEVSKTDVAWEVFTAK